MRRVILTVIGTVIGLVLLLSFKTHPLSSAAASPPAIVVPSTGDSSTPSAEPSTAPTPSAGSTFEASPSQAPTTTTKPSPTKTAAPTTTAPKTTAPTSTRTVTGDAVDTRYGPVQVQVVLSGKTIKDVTVLQVPAQSNRDVEINNYAVPVLNQETLAAQSANIDMVSGATYTSQGYLQSLQSALDKA